MEMTLDYRGPSVIRGRQKAQSQRYGRGCATDDGGKATSQGHGASRTWEKPGVILPGAS